MKTKSQILKRVILCAGVLFALTACDSFTPESSKDVIQKFKETAKEIKAADFAVEGTMTGVDKADKIDLSVGVGAKFDQREGVDRKGDLKLKLGGMMTAAGKSLSGDLDVEIRTLGDNFFFNIAKLNADDPSMAKYKEIIDGYRGKWLKLSSDFVPESLKQFQKKDEKAIEREKQLKDLFVSIDMFDVNKEFGVESLNGKRVYHYGIKVNEAGLKDYSRKSARVDGREMSDAEVDQSVAFASSVANVEMWIGTEDYYLYKGVATLTGGEAEGVGKSKLDLTFTGNSYNADPKIVSPENPESFNPITLMMQLQLLNPPAEEAPATDATVIEPVKKEPVKEVVPGKKK